MFASKIIDQQNDSYMEFLGKTAMAFGGLSPATHYGEQNLAIYEANEMVAGITLVPYRNILIDTGLTKYFDVNRALPAVKMTRLWRQPSRKKDSLVELFKTTYEHIDKNCYLYGVLVLPLSFVEKRKEFFSNHMNLVAPITHYSECEWDRSFKPAANCQSLLNIYINFGAELLGAPAACENEKAVRVVMGMPASEIKFQQFLDRINS